MGLFGMRKYLIEEPEKYEKKEREVIVLVRDNPSGSRIPNRDKMWKAVVPLLACIDCRTGALLEGEHYLAWNYEDSEDRNRHGIKELETYRLKVLFSKPSGNIPSGRSLFVTKVTGRNVSEPRLEEILTEYRKPIFAETAGGERLELNKKMGVFEGSIPWCGEYIDIYISADDGEDTCEGGMKILNELAEKDAEWDKKVKTFAATTLTELARDWQADEDEEPITEEAFAERITLCGIDISEDGDINFWFDDNDMFCGHSVMVSGTVEDGFTDAEIAG